MQIIDFQKENSVGVALHFRHWQAEEARAVVCLVHGLGEHIGRYEHVAQFFSAKKIATIGFDHQGHGQTKGKRGHTEGLESMLDDVDLLVKMAWINYPNLPVFLYGHSMGGNVVLNFVIRRKPTLTGLVVSAPWIQLPVPPSPLLVFFGKLMNQLFPKLTQANGLNVNELSNDPKVIEAYQKDPLVHDKISVRAGTSLLEAAKWLDVYEGKLPCPTLLMHGGLDRITSPKGTAAFAKRTKGDVTWKEWDGLKHEIHNEPQQNEVLTILIEWIERFI